MTSVADTPALSKNYARPIAATIGVVFRNHQVLLVQRKNAPDAGLWGLPGGKIDHGESITAAATREIYEETSVVTKAIEVFTAVDVINTDHAGALRHHFVLIAVLCGWLKGDPVAGDDALDARWWNLDSLDEARLVMSFGVIEVVRQGYALFQSR